MDNVPQLIKISGQLVAIFKGVRILLLVILLMPLIPPAIVYGTMVPPGKLCLVALDICCSVLLAGAGTGHSPCENHF